jgi:cystathionine gamma-lyase
MSDASTPPASNSSLSPISLMLHHRTQALQRGEPVTLPIAASTTFHLPGDPDGVHFYARNGNPTVEDVEARIGLLEGADSVLFPSGMAAVCAVFAAVLRPGDRVLVHADGYYNVRGLLDRFFRAWGVAIEALPARVMDSADLTGIRLIMAETPTNPGLSVCDLALLAGRARSAGAILAVDNTTPTPLCQRPLDLGAHIAFMADTKAMAGHSDVMAGHVATREPELLTAIRDWRRLSGAILSPFEAFLLARGLETLELRVARANANALAIASALRHHPMVQQVSYPGLREDPSHAIASRQMTGLGFGPIVSFTLADRAQAETFIARHPLCAAATSFGGTHSSAECRIRWGDAVPPGFVRFACGIEPTADLVTATLHTLDSL